MERAGGIQSYESDCTSHKVPKSLHTHTSYHRARRLCSEGLIVKNPSGEGTVSWEVTAEAETEKDENRKSKEVRNEVQW